MSFSLLLFPSSVNFWPSLPFSSLCGGAHCKSENPSDGCKYALILTPSPHISFSCTMGKFAVMSQKSCLCLVHVIPLLKIDTTRFPNVQDTTRTIGISLSA
ncbi:hypothetical protein L218DRAFT_579521 [Marasmius fiardii PR-910]|nr:hypothetical protein L218DRAFT_579521 [Marasmius fiardii PR-910]